MNMIVFIILLSLGCQASRSQEQVSRSDGEISVIEGEERLKCGEKEFQETRNNYENCASEKIGSVTSWLQKVTAGDQGEQEVVISEVCSHVQDLLHSCGDELGWCFTADQVEETKNVQKSGIRDILRRHLPQEKVENCLENSTLKEKGEQITGGIRPEPRSLLIQDTKQKKINNTQTVSENNVDDVFNLSQDAQGNSTDNRESEQMTSSNKPTEVTNISTTKLLRLSTQPSTQQPSASTLPSRQQPSASTLPSRQQPSSPPSLNRAATYPTECDPPTCGCQSNSTFSFQIIISVILLTVFSQTNII